MMRSFFSNGWLPSPQREIQRSYDARIPRTAGTGLLVLSATFGLLAVAPAALGNGFTAQGREYAVAGLLSGDQVVPSLSLGKAGGLIVWQDNATDGDGFGISARRLNEESLAAFEPFRVNQLAAGDQQRPQVAMLPDGGAFFIWQGGPSDSQRIYARVINANGTFTTADLPVSLDASAPQQTPAVAALADDSIVVVWSSMGLDGSLQGIFGQRLSSSGARLGQQFQVNQFSDFNQRTPSVAGLPDGRFVVAWVSEQQRFEGSVDVYARVLGGEPGSPTGEFLVNTGTNLCANPAVCAGGTSGFLVGWSQRDIGKTQNAWDVYVRPFDLTGAAAGAPLKANTHEKGNHYAPQIARSGDTHLAVWTSFGQDGSYEGIFGRALDASGKPLGAEFQVNTTSASAQIYPAVASDGKGQFLVAWSSFIGGPTSFDLLAQRYAPAAFKPAAPFVAALSSSRLSVSWPKAESASVASYEVYVNGDPKPVAVNGNLWTSGPLAPGSTHSFRLVYRYQNGESSAVSDQAQGTTWGTDENLDGLPDDWQASFWGENPSRWPDPKADGDADGASNLQEFLAGTSPADASSVLKTRLTPSPQGTFLSWNTRPGFVYQVQLSTDLNSDWQEVGLPRFANGASDSMLVERAGDSVYYRVKRLR